MRLPFLSGARTDHEPPSAPSSVKKTFRLTAVRRPAPWRFLRGRPAAPVADEELITELWRRRARFEEDVGAALTERFDHRVAVRLEELRPEHSVSAHVAFVSSAAT